MLCVLLNGDNGFEIIKSSYEFSYPVEIFSIIYFPLLKRNVSYAHFKKLHVSVQFSLVAQSCPTLCDPMNHSAPGLPVHHQLQSPPKPMSIELVMPSNISSSVVPFSSCPQSFPALGSFPMSWLFLHQVAKYWSFSFSTFLYVTSRT